MLPVKNRYFLLTFIFACACLLMVRRQFMFVMDTSVMDTAKDVEDSTRRGFHTLEKDTTEDPSEFSSETLNHNYYFTPYLCKFAPT